MSRALLVIGAMFFSSYCVGQTNTFPASGNVTMAGHLQFTSIDQEIQFFRGGSLYGYLWTSALGLHWGKGSQGNSITIDNSGNLGIGTVYPTEKLSVKGKIRAQEIKVENANWPDFVFAKSYTLPTLKETETHIKEKGHLPGIPSAAEVKANGVDLGDMNAKLLQKIEELTLYIIDLEKRMKKVEDK